MRPPSIATRASQIAAKGMLSERTGLGVAEAFEAMRTYARVRRLTLGAVAAGVIDGSLDSVILVT